MVSSADFEGRRAPYAPISALERFFERIRDRAVPDHVDHRFLQKLNVASNNEYSLLSALKFLGVVDDRGRPTHAYRLLQSSDRFQDTLRHLVETAYKPVFDIGAERWPTDDLTNYFRRTSSASQAKNAARFFQSVCRMAGMTGPGSATSGPRSAAIAQAEVYEEEPGQAEAREWAPATASHELVLRAKVELVRKLPQARDDWSAQDYRGICESFVEMMKRLDA